MSKRYEVKFYVGTGCDFKGRQLYRVTERRAEALAHFTQEYGAVTVYEHYGVWGTDDSEVVGETGITFLCVIENAALKSVTPTAQFLKTTFDQSAVLVTRSVIEAEFI